eukprot:scaffold7700_cov132-Isochrysis_galbana.AAC.5
MYHGYRTVWRMASTRHAYGGRLSEQTFCRTNLDLQHRWVKWRGSLAHPVVLRWVARAFRR